MMASKLKVNSTATLAWHRPVKMQGFVLVLVLLFMLSLGLVAASGMRSVSTAERIAANERDRLLAFEAAESAGAEAIARIDKGNTSSDALGIYASMNPLGAYSHYWLYSSSISTITSCTAGSSSKYESYALSKRFNWSLCALTANRYYENTAAPQYVIEKISSSSVSGTSPARTRYFYRITARATGGSGQVEVIVQLNYFKDWYCDSVNKTCVYYQDPGSHKKVWRQLQ